MTAITLPDGYHLAYTVTQEAHWYAGLRTHDPALVPGEGHPQVFIHCAPDGGKGAKWEFAITDRELRHEATSLRLEMFDDSWADAFTGMVPFFAALAGGSVKTIDDVRALLDSLGAVDETER